MTAAVTPGVSSDDRPHAHFALRLLSAVERRVRRALRRTNTTEQGHGVEQGLEWLVRATAAGVGAKTSRTVDAAALCAAGIPFAELGAMTEARDCAARSLLQWRGDGALPDATGKAPSLFATAQFVRLAHVLADDANDALPESQVRAACNYILAHIDRGGQFIADEGSNSLTDRWASPLARLACLSPVAALARRWDEPHWRQLIERAVARSTAAVDLTPWTTPSHLWAQAVSALIELGHEDAALANSRWLELAQRDSGAVAFRIDDHETSAWATAHAAEVWYALGMREHGDRAMHWLASLQRVDGSFAASDAGLTSDKHASIWTAIHFLRGTQAQVRASFASQRDDLPTTIDPADGRYLAVQQWLRLQEQNAKILDAGCGKGRFIHRLRTDFAGKRWIGVDGSQEALVQLPLAGDVERRWGDVLRLPVAEAECDAAYMIEALEHALVPRRAIEELCRAVRPGGAVLVIDKCRSQQSLSRHEPWERWFTAEEVCAWLAPHCEEVTVRPIPHGDHRQPTGLFLCWTARKRGRAMLRRAA